MTILQHGELVVNPKSGTAFQSGDRIGFIGDEREIAAVDQLLNTSIEGGNEDNDPS